MSDPSATATIVIDVKFGSGESCLAGFAGDDVPTVVVPSSKYNKDDLESLYRDVFKQLNVDPSHYSVLLTESPFNTPENEDALGTMMFETFNVQALAIAKQPVLALYASGKRTGCVLECSADESYIVPIIESREISDVIKDGLTSFSVTGNDLSSYLFKALVEQGYPFATAAEHEIVRDIKDKVGYVATNFAEELNKQTTQRIENEENSIDKNYELPTGQVIVIGNARFRAPEILFKPNMIGKSDQDGVHEAIYLAIMKSSGGPGELRNKLFDNIVLSGSNTLFPGFAERLATEIKALVPQGIKVNIIAPVEGRFSTWIGGSIAAGLDEFAPQFIYKQEYEQKGAKIVHQKIEKDVTVVMS